MGKIDWVKVGKRIRETRTTRGYTLEQLGGKIGVSHGYLSKIETGKKDGNLKLLEELSEIFNLPIAYFLDEVEIQPSHLNPDMVKWISFAEKMDKKELTPEQIEDIINVVQELERIRKQ